MAAKNPSLAVYLGEEMMDRVTAAKEAGQFEPKEVVKAALEAAMAGQPPIDKNERQQWTEELLSMRAKSEGYDAQFAAMVEKLGGSITSWDELFARLDALLGTERELQLRSVGETGADLGGENPETITASALLHTPGVDYDTTYSDDLDQVTARLDALNAQDGYPVSLSQTLDGRYLLLAAWPQE